MPGQLFIFMQMEFPWALGPADGRYLLRLEESGEAERVVVLDTLPPRRDGAARRPPESGLRGAFARLFSHGGGVLEASSEAAPVTSTRVTVIDPVSLSAESQARAWLEDLDRERDVLAATAVVNRVLHSHRIAAADPYVHEVSPAQALVIRAGWGEGEQVAGGLWLHARELAWGPRGRSRRARRTAARAAVLRPQERLAALLGARGRALLCEELALRARLDLDQGRACHAALELENALAVAVPELRGERREDLAIRVAELEQLHAGVVVQAGAAARGEEPDEEVLAHALERIEAALRARTAAGVSVR